MGFSIKNSFYYPLSAYLSIVRKDLKTKFPIPIRKKFRMWRNGFLAEKLVLYNLDQKDASQFLSDYHTSQARWINEPFLDILTNKYIFSLNFASVIRVPAIYAMIIDGQIRNLNQSSAVVDFNSFIEECKKTWLILKPVTGGGGRGVWVARREGETIFLNNDRYTETDLRKKLSALNNYLITEFIVQAEYADRLYPHSTNTLRIVTLQDADSHRPFIARAVQRIGNAKSAPQDNFTKGGLSANIDLETGVLSSAASHPFGPELEWHDVHPSTGVKIKDAVVWNWDLVKKSVLDAAENAFYLRVIGWDIVVTETGVVAIEGNHHPDPDVLQCHGPLFSDERIRRFYRRHGII